MATSVQLKPSENFDFSKPDNWEKWKKRFEEFRVAAGLKDENEPRQVSTLLYCMGEEYLYRYYARQVSRIRTEKMRRRDGQIRRFSSRPDET